MGELPSCMIGPACWKQLETWVKCLESLINSYFEKVTNETQMHKKITTILLLLTCRQLLLFSSTDDGFRRCQMSLSQTNCHKFIGMLARPQVSVYKVVWMILHLLLTVRQSVTWKSKIDCVIFILSNTMAPKQKNSETFLSCCVN